MKNIRILFLTFIAVNIYSCKDKESNPISNEDPPIQKFWQQTICSYTNVRSFCESTDGILYAETPNGIIKSTDAGNSWQHSLSAYTEWSVAAGSNGKVYASDLFGIYRSSDYGITWSYSDSGLAGVNTTDVIVHPTGMVFSGTLVSGVFKSTDSGISWNKTSMPDRDVRSLYIDQNGNIYAGCNYRGTVLFKSTDNGVSWEEKTTLTNDCIYSIASDTNGNLYVGGLGKIFKSTDDGIQWSIIASKSSASGFMSICAVTQDWIFIVPSGSGIYMSTNAGQTWEQNNSGITNPWASSLILDSRGYLFSGSFNNGIYRSINKLKN